MNVLRTAGRAFVFVPDDGFGPIGELEHVIRYDCESLRCLLTKKFEVPAIESMRDANLAMSVLFAQVRAAS